MRRLSNKERARDVAQETYLKLILAAEHTTIRTPRAYLFRIASNVIYEQVKQERRCPIRFDSWLVERLGEQAIDPTADEVSGSLSTHQQVYTTLVHLRPLDAAILVLKEYNGMTIEEIARELGISVHTAKKYLCRAIKSCRISFAATHSPER